MFASLMSLRHFATFIIITFSCTLATSLTGNTAPAQALSVNASSTNVAPYSFLLDAASSRKASTFLQNQQQHFSFLAQTASANSSTTITPSSNDNSKTLTILLAILLLPLGWGPTRKAVGLVNIIVGTILTVTGIGAIFGIPMILMGGICLFI